MEIRTTVEREKEGEETHTDKQGEWEEASKVSLRVLFSGPWVRCSFAEGRGRG